MNARSVRVPKNGGPPRHTTGQDRHAGMHARKKQQKFGRFALSRLCFSSFCLRLPARSLARSLRECASLDPRVQGMFFGICKVCYDFRTNSSPSFSKTLKNQPTSTAPGAACAVMGSQEFRWGCQMFWVHGKVYGTGRASESVKYQYSIQQHLDTRRKT